MLARPKDDKPNPYVRTTINMDVKTRQKCVVLANDMTTSVSGLLRVLVRQAYEVAYPKN